MNIVTEHARREGKCKTIVALEPADWMAYSRVFTLKIEGEILPRGHADLLVRRQTR